MRETPRPPVECRCGARLFWGDIPIGFAGTLVSPWEPPARHVDCPSCHAQLDTSGAYPFISGMPAGFEQLLASYEGFRPVKEFHPQSLEERIHEGLTQLGAPALLTELNHADGRSWLRDRLHYRSTKSFYRSLQLFFAFLTLERRSYRTWAGVTGYYARFFFIQAFLNLLQVTWLSQDSMVLLFDGTEFQLLPKKILSPTIKSAHSHEIWWQLMEALKLPPGYPVDELNAVLTRLVFSPSRRNTENYDFRYGEGFPELEWFDHEEVSQMMSHFRPTPRPDRDITSIDAYFAGMDPEWADAADYYTDDALVLWTSIKVYLQLLIALRFPQDFIRTDKIAALTEVHLWSQYPTLVEGILRETTAILGDCYDVPGFIAYKEVDPTAPTYFRSIPNREQ
jgi:hypothetical protein